MATDFIGTTFAPNSQWYQDEIDLIQSIKTQIDNTYIDQKNLLINTTWFGPQFHNGEYEKFINVTGQKKFDNVFLLAAPDPVFLNPEQIQNLQMLSGASKIFLCGNFDGRYQFNFISFVIPKYFQSYDTHELVMDAANYVFICYNRKPRSHRIGLVRKLMHHNLLEYGIVTLGKNDPIFSKTEDNQLFFTLNEMPDDFAKEGNWGMPMVYGIPHDIHSLGNMDLWQQHFLHVVSETEFFPWDNLFVSEKTWKPIIGLRPFLINGQTRVYPWLRQQGFRTFEKYWKHIPVECLPEDQVHDSIVSVLEFVCQKNKKEIEEIYQDMLPDLLHNRQRFFEFAQEQKYKTENLFK